MSAPLRFLLVDDHALVREGLASLLSYQPDMVVVGEAGDAASGVEAARRLRPDLTLMDIDLPDADGISATYAITSGDPTLNVAILTVHDDEARLYEALRAGARGYLLKSGRSTELVPHLREMARGGAAISRRMATRIIEEFGPRDEGGALVEPEARLTVRELEILGLVVARCTNREIADRLFISEHTVKNHLRNILGKLHLDGRRAAAAYAVARGWLRPPTPGSDAFRSRPAAPWCDLRRPA